MARTGQDLERKLFAELQQARKAYTSAINEYKDVLELCDDVGFYHPDAPVAIQRARAVHQSAFARYSEALRAFTDLLIRDSASASEKKRA